MGEEGNQWKEVNTGEATSVVCLYDVIVCPITSTFVILTS